MKRPVQLRIFAVLATLGLFLAAAAPAGADTIVQSFKSSGTIPPGWLVSLKPNTSDTVELTPANQSDHIFGVTIDPSEAPVTLQRQSDQSVFVATSGVYPLLVSTQNGAIHSGDYLSISATSGIAAKAVADQSVIVGQASQSFDGKSGVLSSADGVEVGKINTTLTIEHNPLLKSDVAVPSIIRSVATTIAGKDTSALRIYMGLIVFLAAGVMAFGILLAGIRSAMISIGRNPLSKRSILRALSEVVVAAVAVLTTGGIGVYLLLRL